MSAIWLIAAVELQRRWRQLLLLTMLVAMVSGAVMASVVAAERADSSVDRYVEWSRMSSAGLSFDASDPGPMLEALRSVPEVEAIAVSSTLSIFVDDGRGNQFGGISLTLTAPDPLGDQWTDDVSGIDVDRPILVEGRLPRPDRSDEILLFEWKAAETGWAVGDRFTGRTIALADVDMIMNDQFPGLNGPVLPLQIVGIGRSGHDVSGWIGENQQSAIGSSQLVSETRDEALWWPPNLDVKTSDSADEFDLVAALEDTGLALVDAGNFAGVFVGGVTDARSAAVQTATATAHTMAVGLMVFGIGALVAGAIVLGQAVTRHVAAASPMMQTLGELGQSRRDRAIAVSLPVGVSAAVGVGAGSILAVVASRFVPTGLARRAEVDPGMWVRPELIAPIGVASVALVTGFCFLVAVGRRATGADRQPTSVMPAAIARLDPSPAIDLGLRLAFVRGRPPRTLPTRSAFTGLTIAVIGVTAALLLTHNVQALTDTPSRWGWNWSTSPDYEGTTPEVVLDGVAADPDIEAAAMFLANGVSLNGTPTGGFAVEPIKEEIDITVRDGRLPQGPGEVSIGRRTMERLDIDIGDTAALGDFVGGNTRTVTVVGTAVFPFDIAETSDDGVVMFADTLFSVTDPATKKQDLLLRYSENADVDELGRTLEARYGLLFHPFATPRPPADVRNLAVTQQVAIALGAFSVALGVLAAWHVGVVTGRRRRLDLALLRALGMLRRQVRLAILTQSLMFGSVALVVGVPLGLVLGRFAWRSITGDLGVVTTASAPWWQVLALVPTVLTASAMMAWSPARTAAREVPAAALRAE